MAGRPYFWELRASFPPSIDSLHTILRIAATALEGLACVGTFGVELSSRNCGLCKMLQKPHDTSAQNAWLNPCQRWLEMAAGKKHPASGWKIARSKSLRMRYGSLSNHILFSLWIRQAR